MSETITADKWLYSTLTGDATLMAILSGVYADVAPEGATFPLGIISLYEAGDVPTINGVRIMVNALYQVKVVGDGPSFVALGAAVDRIDTLLHRASGTVSGGAIFACVRVEPLRYTEHASGHTYKHLGGLYRLLVQ